jgi:hypothetical protein
MLEYKSIGPIPFCGLMVLTVWTTILMSGSGWVVATLASLLACSLGMLCFTGYMVIKTNCQADMRVYVGTEPFPEVELNTETIQGVAAVIGLHVVVGRPVEANTLRAAGLA